MITFVPMILFPNAKINLGLIIKGRRPDGYHLMETLFVPVASLTDVLELTPTASPGCTLVQGGMPLDSTREDNLVVKAYRGMEAFLQAQGRTLGGVHLNLTKRIPAGAGLGGGSADAAFALRGLNDLFALKLTPPELEQIARPLGADVPFFLHNQPILARGIGNEFEEIAIALPYRIEVITSHIHSSTPVAFRGLNLADCNPARELKPILALPDRAWRYTLPNDLEKPVFAEYPELAQTKQRLYDEGAVYAAMSGSGSSIFGLFVD
jgi:4-diphosphocytidyl-2-C-methyl-D-erythritol kinase